MSKKLYSYRLSDEAAALLKIICEKQDRSGAYIIEQLIKEEAKKQKIKSPKS